MEENPFANVTPAARPVSRANAMGTKLRENAPQGRERPSEAVAAPSDLVVTKSVCTSSQLAAFCQTQHFARPVVVDGRAPPIAGEAPFGAASRAKPTASMWCTPSWLAAVPVISADSIFSDDPVTREARCSRNVESLPLRAQ